MNWVLRDRYTSFYVAHDLIRGYHFTTNRRRAALFSDLKSARQTVLLVCNGEREINRKARLEAIRVSELRRVDQRRYFTSRNRTKG